MNQELVLTVVAEDRPGLVGTLSAVIAEHDASWVDSSMARLGGQFAGILRIMVDTQKAEALSSALLALKNSGFTVGVHSNTAGRSSAGA